MNMLSNFMLISFREMAGKYRVTTLTFFKAS